MGNKVMYLICFLFSAVLGLAGCGGGGGSPAAATLAVVKINLTGTLPGATALGGAQFTLTLPANVAPTTLPGTNDATSAVTPSGIFAGGIAGAAYTAGTPGSMNIIMITTASVTQVGEIATIVLNLANGAAPTVPDFALSGVQVIDSGGNNLLGITAVVASVTLK